ncbi:Crp/Fnr family transcriptional regulator [Acrocarpospora pleiomorpha]|uniref:Crp/Fnr family transcriptional regulator n=1 Tax=Acrocarpospora pleiomorpha TaxID=90975 RepID=A0A5M3XDN4_9ACTN|nr:Crp/Fnr family transcriptional regulator [Acrocarpospora pleiomorpha]GES18882.1 Crp/Fnr family transcriptional regulator [Acrocarpospora pleiomorpha]
MELGAICPIADGTAFLRQGEPGTLVYLILQGLVKITARAENGEQVLLAVRVRGDLVGEMAVLGRGTRSADVTACGAVNVLAIHGNAFLGYLQRKPVAGFAVSGALSDRLQWANQRRLDFAGFGADVCLARILLSLAARHGYGTAQGRDIGVPLTRAELGGLIGIKEPTVRKAMRTLSDLGLILRAQRRVVIKDLPELARFAELIPLNR